MQEERRQVSRFPLTAPAELLEEKTDTRSTAYLTNLGLYGCTVGVTRPPRRGVSIRIEILTGNESFPSRATVAQSSGLIFQNLQPQSLVVLRSESEEGATAARRAAKMIMKWPPFPITYN